MKKLLSIASIVLFSAGIYAQSGNDYLELARDVLKTEKKAVIAEVMQLTETESTPFWELYNEYQGKLYLVQNKRIALIKDFADNFENLSDEKADQLWISAMAFGQEVLKLEKQYYKKFKKILPAGKAARFFQAENKIETMIDAQLALEIPLIETN
jgi:vacuolar-type H+-ATPase subunit D/Vma8